jgi:P-type E1-E2 ATPase
MRFLSVLVVATPCPLLIAIPITIISAISMSAKRGIVIKDPTVLERLPTCKIAIFDKTGTLTYGQPELTEIIIATEFSKEEILQKAASLERYSRHPLAYAILKAAKKENLELLEAENVSEKPGQGLIGKVAQQEILITSRNKLQINNPQIISFLPPISSGLECVILINSKYAATLRLHDTPRLEGQSFISHLGPQHNFDRIILLSGDRESEVEYLANNLGIKEMYASQTPEQKLDFVRNETKKSATLFMGDGINDAPALMAATVGLAFGQHSNVTSEAAGAVIMENTLVKVDELFHISDKMRHIASQSAIGGMLLSLGGMALAASGSLSPVEGALLQEFIDIAAILNALRMTWEMKVFSDLEEKS